MSAAVNPSFDYALGLQPVALWAFNGTSGLTSHGQEPYTLHNRSRPLTYVHDPYFGAVARFDVGQYLYLPRAECVGLDVHGNKAQLTVVAWVKRGRKSPADLNGKAECEAVAGIWNETQRQRQYCLFLNLQIWESAQQVGGHVSATGGPTPGYQYCMDAAIGSTPVSFDTWHSLAMTYDGKTCRVYLDGVLDARDERNPYPYAGGIFSGDADFTVGAVHRGGGMGNFFVGWMAGVCVYDRVLSIEQLHSIAAFGLSGR